MSDFTNTIRFVLYASFQALFLYEKSFAQDSVTCIDDQELTFFCAAKVFPVAKKACEDRNSYLVKVDNANMTEVVNLLFDKSNCSYPNDIFIGAKASPHLDYPHDRSKRIWKWLDGSKVYSPTDTGYQNWQTGQPNDIGKQEDCLIVDKYNKQWKDTICSGTPPDPKYYICQKTQSKFTIRIEEILDGVECEASAGSCAVYSKWRRGETVVTNNSSNAVYQTNSRALSVLHYENATIGDAGHYTCVAWMDEDKLNYVTDSTYISVDGAPEINDTVSFKCNTSLGVLWKPNGHSLGYRHRIITTTIPHSGEMNIAEVTPGKRVVYFTEVSGLNSSTEYKVTIVACNETNNCPDEYATSKTATTRGIIVKVSNATLQQTNATDNDTCVVTWEGIHNHSITSYQLTIHNSSQLGSSKNNIACSETITGTNYSFTAIPDEEYKVEIQPVTNESYCPQSLKAVGSCVGKNHDIVNEEGESKQANILLIIIPSAAAGGVVLLAIFILVFCKRMKSTGESTEGMTTNPIYGVTDYGDLHSSSNHQDVRDQEGAVGGECSTTKREDPNEAKDCSSDAAIYAVVNKSNSKEVEEKGGDVTKSNTAEDKAAQSNENMVANPIYDMEGSTSQPTASDNDQKVDSGTVDTDQQSSTDDPIYSAVKKVKIKKNKKGD